MNYTASEICGKYFCGRNKAGFAKGKCTSSGTWPGWIPRKTTIVSSLPHYVHHLTGGDPPVVQEQLGWERLGRTYSHRISGFTWHGGRQRREILGIRSSVRQCSARSLPPRRRRLLTQSFLLCYCLDFSTIGRSSSDYQHSQQPVSDNMLPVSLVSVSCIVTVGNYADWLRHSRLLRKWLNKLYISHRNYGVNIHSMATCTSIWLIFSLFSNVHLRW